MRSICRINKFMNGNFFIDDKNSDNNYHWTSNDISCPEQLSVGSGTRPQHGYQDTHQACGRDIPGKHFL